MDSLEAMIRRVPERAQEVRRLFWHDPEFRAVCEDHRDAALGLAQAQRRAPASDRRRKDFEELIGDLVAEALEMLDRERSKAVPPRQP